MACSSSITLLQALAMSAAMAATTFTTTAASTASFKTQSSFPPISSKVSTGQNSIFGARLGSGCCYSKLRSQNLTQMQNSSSNGVMASARGDFSPGTSASSATLEAAEKQKAASELVQEFYAAINRREIDSIGDLFAHDCVYEDLVFPKPFLGRKAVLEFFKKFVDSVGPELEFRIDDISTADPDSAGVIWHLEWRGKPFPFSKGCSFYRCEVVDGKRQIKYGRDSVEPAAKPGDFTLVALRGVAALLRKFPSLADRF